MFKKDRFSIRKIKGVVGSVFLGSLLMAPSVVDAATYHYVNKEIISQEAKDLIQTGKPDRNEVVYGLVYQKDQLPQTGTEASVLTAFGLLTVGSLLLIYKRKKIASVFLVGAMGLVVLPSAGAVDPVATLALASREGVVEMEGYRYVGYLSGDILKTLGLDTVLEETSAKPGEVTVVEVETPQSITNQEQARTENQVVETEEAPKEEAPKTEESPKEEPKSEVKPTDDTLPKVEEGKEDSAEPAPVEEVGGEVESKSEEKVAVKPESQLSDKPAEESKVEPPVEQAKVPEQPVQPTQAEQPSTPKESSQEDNSKEDRGAEETPKQEDEQPAEAPEIKVEEPVESKEETVNQPVEQPKVETPAVEKQTEPTEEPKVEQAGEPVAPREDEQAPTAPVEPEKQPEVPEEEKAVEETPKPEDKIKGIGTKEPVDKSELNNQIDKASSVSPIDYSTASYNALGPVLETAKGVYASEPVKQPEVNSETNKLKTAIDALNVDKTELNNTIADAKTKVKEHYSDRSWQNLQTRVTEAEKVAANTDAKQSEVNSETASLKTAISGLNTDKVELENQLKIAQGKTETDFSMESWTVLSTAKNKAQEVKDNGTATQEQINEAEKSLKTALADLSVDKTALGSAIDTATKKNKENYTNQTWAELKTALTAAKSVNTNESKQSDVNEAAEKLTATMEKLVELSEKPRLTLSIEKRDIDRKVTVTYTLENPANTQIKSITVTLKKGEEVVKDFVLTEENLKTNHLTALFEKLDYYKEYTLSTDMVYNRGNDDETESISEELIQLNLKKLELKDIQTVSLMKFENGQESQVTHLSDKPTDLSKLYLKVTSSTSKDAVLAVSSIEEEIVENKKIFKIHADTPELVVRKKDGSLSKGFDYYMERVIPHDGDIYYDFKDLISAMTSNPTGTFILGRDISSRNVKPDGNGKSYIKGEFKGKLLGTNDNVRHSIFDLEYPLFDTIKSGVVKDIDFKHVNMVFPDSNQGDNVATIARVIKDKTKIENVNVEGYLEGRDHVAGLVNNLEGNSEIENVSFTGKIKSKGGNSITAGIAGRNILSRVKRAYVNANIEVLGSTNSSMLVAVNGTTLNASGGWGTWGRLTESVAKGTLEIKRSGQAGGVTATVWPYGAIDKVVSYAKVTKGKELFGSDGDLNNNWFMQKINNIFGVQGISSGDSGNDSKFKRISEEEAKQKVASYNITAPNLMSDSSLLVDRLNESWKNTDQFESIQDYQSQNQLIYQNLTKFTPYYNKEFIVHEGNALTPEQEILKTKKIKSIVGLKGTEFVVDGSDIDTIMLHFEDGSQKRYKVTSTGKFSITNLPEYQVEDLNVVYTSEHIVHPLDSSLINNLVEELKKVELYTESTYQVLGIDKDNANKLNRTKRLFLDESLDAVKTQLPTFVKTMFENEWLHINGESSGAVAALRQKIIDNKTAILLALTYINRYYDVKFSDYNIKKLMLFKPTFHGEKIDLLDRLIRLGSSGENRLKGSENAETFKQLFASETKQKDLVTYLDYNRSLLTNYQTTGEWFKETTKDYIQFEERPSLVEEIKDAKYRVYDNLTAPYYQGYILPLLTLKNTHLAILSNYSTMTFVSREKRPNWKNEDFDKWVKYVATAHRNHVDTWYKILPDNIKGKMVKENVTAVWEGLSIPGSEWVDQNAVDRKGRDYAPAREFFNLVGGPMGGWYAYHGYGAHAGGRNRVNYEVFDVLSEYGISVFTHELTHVNDTWIYLGGYGRRENMGPEAYAQGLFQSPVPGQPGWGALGLNMAFERENDGNLIYNASPTQFENRKELDSYMKNYNDTLMMVDYLEGDAVISKGKEAITKWFKKVEPKVVSQTAQYDTVRQLTAEEKEKLSVSSVDDLVDQGLMSDRAVGNNTYNPADFETSYIAIDYMTGIYGGGKNSVGSPGALMFKHNTFRMWGYYGFEEGVLGYASNKFKQASRDEGHAGLSDNFIISKISKGEFLTMEAFKKGYFKKVVEELKTKGIRPVTINQKTYSTFEELQEGFKQAVERDLKKNQLDERETRNFKFQVFRQLLQQTNSFKTSIFR
ncbi:ZmpA/ZmpB/ZmpC family metallo-endopeptidase [Streptococcus pneumoniae]|nr:ZmpA/ZmpB/ZmpC family metallo-endopeptidase [Streptococcus pneumoniae]MDS2404561.1 ZmpA/ZmpB/ZmpC family metallo-endopeptidase [Streptococcus pneumoniae]MDS2411215.1 ZmpA/ZmpB/ZmpC family metallo-endopeptidase [Streptococcus pneumoniae]MDS2534304.1 ZmpA/ZmpB/ZmpC family metallo-endopeptidase [Streptococcus pneumoniae]MDS2685375.1 ZmpA/ZmpB/ZmpC family metallo-endopeptidase [Streptococcus pneumoniae]